MLATGAAYRRLPLDELAEYEGVSVFYAAGPPEAQQCGASRVAVVGGGNSAGQAAVWLARGGALVTLIHRRADLAETMSDYLIHELDRYGVVVRDRSEIAALHGANGQLEAVTLKSGELLPFSALFLFLGAAPCTEWLDDAVARDADGFILTGDAAGADHLLETSVQASSPPGMSGPAPANVARSRGRRIDGRTVRPPTPGAPDSSSRMSELCTHLDQVALRELPASVEGCEDCLRAGSKWLHLRICLTCGHIGCCDSSPNRHATAHHQATSHPIIRSIEPGEDWSWCYVDEVTFVLDGIRGTTQNPPSPLAF